MSVTIMIEKDSGNPRIECLRVIHLFEADCNLSLNQCEGNNWYIKGMTATFLAKSNLGNVLDIRLSMLST
jgi:hypothetical protein